MDSKDAITLVVAVLLVAGGPPGIGSAVATEDVWVNVTPATLDHGDTEQSIAVFVEGVDERTELVLNVSSLSAAGVDLSDASVEIDRSSEMAATATVDRSGEDVRVRITLAPGADGPSEGSVELRLTGLETADASHTRLAYTVSYEGSQQETQSFKLDDPDLPWVSPLTRSDDLVVGDRNATQHTTVTLDDVPADERATLRIDLSTLQTRNVGLSNVTVTARLTDPREGATLGRVETNGSAVDLVVRTARETDVTVALTLVGLDTRDADPASDQRYVVEFDGAAGTTSGHTQPFGVYAAGNTPTPTPAPTTTPPVASPDGTPGAQTPAPTPGPTTDSPTVRSSDGDANTGERIAAGSGPGFGALPPVVALLAAVLVASRRS